ncbi:MAG: hypothetical protein Q4B99_05350 [Clostridia bacterium]|nr:hypothetical protein [Clostridia bacterium]
MQNKGSLTIYTIAHFFVDAVCFFMLFGAVRNSIGDSQVFIYGLLVYNAVAFGMQPLIGMLCDKLHALSISTWGCFLLAMGALLGGVPWLSICLCGLGNAAFHVGGGIDSLVYADGKLARSGIFVASGALGVATGTLAASGGWLHGSPMEASLPVLLMGICGLVCVFFLRDIPAEEYSVKRFGATDAARSDSFVILICAAAVVVRSFAGANVQTQWGDAEWLVLIPAACACAGKVLGGILSDRFGASFVAAVSLLLSVPFIALLSAYPVCCAIGLVLFNMAMPITLCAIAERLPSRPGLAFGITTLGLLIGAVPMFLFVLPETARTIAVALLTLGAAVGLRFALGAVKLPFAKAGRGSSALPQ